MKPVFSTISYGLYNIESSLIEDGFCTEKILEEIVAKTGLHIVKKQKHEFSPQGLITYCYTHLPRIKKCLHYINYMP